MDAGIQGTLMACAAVSAFNRVLNNDHIELNTRPIICPLEQLKKGGCSPQKKPKKTKKNQKKPSQFTNFGVATGFFWFFFCFFWVFLVFFWFFLVFFGIFWDDILTLNLNTKKNQKIPKKTKKNQKKPTEPKKPVSNFECWPRPMPKKTKKSQKKPKKTKKNQFPISNSGQNQCQKKPKKTKKNQKKPMPIWKFKKTKKNQKKTKKNQCQFTDFGVATGFFWFFLGEHPPKKIHNQHG